MPDYGYLHELEIIGFKSFSCSRGKHLGGKCTQQTSHLMAMYLIKQNIAVKDC